MTSTEKTLFCESLAMFMAFGRHQSLAKAAKEFGVSHSSASRKIRHLEEILEADLIVKGKRPYAMTPEARRFYATMQGVSREIDEALDDLRGKRDAVKALRIGFIESFTQAAASIISESTEEFTSVLNVTGTTDRLTQLFIDGEIEVLATSELPRDIAKLQFTTFLREPTLAVFPREVAKNLPRNPTWKNLSFCGIPYILSYKHSRSGKALMSFLTTNGITFHSRIEVDNIGTKLELIERGRGWSLIPLTSLFQNRGLIEGPMGEKLSFISSPNPAFNRRLYLAAGTAFNHATFEKLAKTIADYTEREILPWAKVQFPEAAKRLEIFHPKEGSEREDSHS